MKVWVVSELWEGAVQGVYSNEDAAQAHLEAFETHFGRGIIFDYDLEDAFDANVTFV